MDDLVKRLWEQKRLASVRGNRSLFDDLSAGIDAIERLSARIAELEADIAEKDSLKELKRDKYMAEAFDRVVVLEDRIAALESGQPVPHRGEMWQLVPHVQVEGGLLQDAEQVVKALNDTPNWLKESWGGSWKNTRTDFDRTPFKAAKLIRLLTTRIVQAQSWLQEVGNDYPGSSCYEWCHKRAAMLTASAQKAKT